LNGYAKNTNPELSKLNIINFSQVSSCGTATAVSVPCMFSGMTRKNYDEKLVNHREGLLDIAQRAGYKVTWIDNNSGCKGACDRVEQYQIPQALKQKWCDASGECFDEILVDSLQDYLKNLKKNDTVSHLIVLHQMGSMDRHTSNVPKHLINRFNLCVIAMPFKDAVPLNCTIVMITRLFIQTMY
jgi:lipid A ethanolaminephosphotransferase